MRQNYKGDKRKKEDARRKKQEEKRNRRFNKSQNTQVAGTEAQPTDVTPENMPVI